MRKLAILLFGAALIFTAKSLTGQGLSGRRAPSFALPDSTLKAYDILDYRGRWLLLDFMKTDCPGCKALTKTLEGIKTRLGAKVAVLSVVEPPENTATAAKYIAETKTTIPILFDSSQTAIFYFKATPQRPSFDTPHLFAIDPNGTIVQDWSAGALGSVSFPNELEQLVKGGGAKK